MVTDAAGTGFEIKKPHKGTETTCTHYIKLFSTYLKLRNPIRGRKLGVFKFFLSAMSNLKLRNPIRGRKLKLFICHIVCHVI